MRVRGARRGGSPRRVATSSRLDCTADIRPDARPERVAPAPQRVGEPTGNIISGAGKRRSPGHDPAVADELPGPIERACAALPADFPAEIRDSITAGALSGRALIKAAASK